MIINDLTGMTDFHNWLTLNHLNHKVIYIITLFVVLAFLINILTDKFRIPSVAGYVLIGALLSESVIKILPFLSEDFLSWYAYLFNSFDFVSILAVSFISFKIGTSLSIKILKRLELEFALIVLLESAFAFILVTLSMVCIGQPLYFALLMGAVATATAPAATVMVLNQFDSRGEFTTTLMIVLALDEVIALIIFSFIEPATLISVSPLFDLSIYNAFLIPLGKIVIAAGLGLIIGYFSQKLMVNYHSRGRKVLLILTTIFGVTALSILFNVSYLIANLAVGFAYRNFAKKRLEIADSIITLTTPLYAFYFILAGSRLDIAHITSSGFILAALVYLIARAAGKITGASLGARLSKAPVKVQKYIGFGLMPQIGVTIDLIYIIQNDFTHFLGRVNNLAVLLFNIILFTTFITELVGPLATEYALNKAGEIKQTGTERPVRS